MSIKNKIIIILFLVAGIFVVYMGLNVDLKCGEATAQDNFRAGLPLLICGIYSIVTSIFLWQKPQIGNILAILTITMFAILILASIFDLSIPIIKTSCFEA